MKTWSIHKCMCVLSCFSCVRLCATPWTVAHQALVSMGFSRQEHWSRLPCPPAGDVPDPGMEPASLMSLALTDRFFTTSAPWEDPLNAYCVLSKRSQSEKTPYCMIPTI